MTIFSVRHITTYAYRRPVRFGDHYLLFRPRDSYDQRLLSSTLATDPEPSAVRWVHDVFGNCVAIVSIPGAAASLRFETRITLDHTPHSGPEFRIDRRALTYPFDYPPEEAPDLAPCIRPHYPDDEVTRWAQRFLHPRGETETGRLLMTLCYAIHESFSYRRRHEPGTQAPLATLRLRRGTCRDFALLMIEALRALGFAARFVTGYVYVPGHDGPESAGHDAAGREDGNQGGGATHAWAQVYLPGAGWVEFDPTNGIVGNRDLIRVAVTRDPSQAVPLAGSYEGAARDFQGMKVQVDVTTLPDTKARTAASPGPGAADTGPAGHSPARASASAEHRGADALESDDVS